MSRRVARVSVTFERISQAMGLPTEARIQRVLGVAHWDKISRTLTVGCEIVVEHDSLKLVEDGDEIPLVDLGEFAIFCDPPEPVVVEAEQRKGREWL